MSSVGERLCVSQCGNRCKVITTQYLYQNGEGIMGSQKNLGEVRKFSLLYRSDSVFIYVFNKFKNKVCLGWIGCMFSTRNIFIFKMFWVGGTEHVL